MFLCNVSVTSVTVAVLWRLVSGKGLLELIVNNLYDSDLVGIGINTASQTVQVLLLCNARSVRIYFLFINS